MIFLSAGHHLKDPGAVSNGLQENLLTIELRDMIVRELQSSGKVLDKDFKIDDDKETLSQYLQRIKTGNGSVVFELHFDASGLAEATGTTMLIPAREWTKEFIIEEKFGKEVVNCCSTILGIKNRGVIDETQSHRGKLGLMREEGINGLLEVCFITNKEDLRKYNLNKKVLAKLIAELLIKYDELR